jgi:hypothetical protein
MGAWSMNSLAGCRARRRTRVQNSKEARSLAVRQRCSLRRESEKGPEKQPRATRPWARGIGRRSDWQSSTFGPKVASTGFWESKISSRIRYCALNEFLSRVRWSLAAEGDNLNGNASGAVRIGAVVAEKWSYKSGSFSMAGSSRGGQVNRGITAASCFI